MNYTPSPGWSYCPPLRSFTASRNVYRYGRHEDYSSDDVCPMCREPYSANAEKPGCAAIRLTECGHILGYQCFQDWITTYPRTCPFYNHTLKAEIELVARDSTMLNYRIETAVMYICNTTIWTFLDDLLLEILIRRSPGPTKLKIHRALRGLYGGSLTKEEANTLRSAYQNVIFNLWINLAIMPVLCVVFIYAVSSILPIGYFAPANDFVFKTSSILTVGFGCFLVVIGLPFLMVLEGILKLSLMEDSDKKED